ERAARGADDRSYPHGDRLDPDDANFYDTYPGAAGPDEVGSHPMSDSPFGLHDMVGNVWELTTSAITDGEHVMRGGAYLFEGMTTPPAVNRQVLTPGLRDLTAGIRLCAEDASGRATR